MPDRPPLPYRWETHLAIGALTLLLAGASPRSSSVLEADAAFVTPELKRWWDAGRAERSRPAWRDRFTLERNVLRGLTSLLLAWRSYDLEHGVRRR